MALRRSRPSQPRRHANRSGDVVEALLAKVGKLDRDFSANLFVGGRRDQMPPGSAIPSSRAATLTPSPRMSSPSIRMSPRLIPIRKSIRRSCGIPSFLWAITAWTATAHSLHRLPRGTQAARRPPWFSRADPVFRHNGVGNLAVFAERAGGADLVKPHEPRVARHIGRDYRRQPASDPRWLLLLHGQAAPGNTVLPEMSPDASLGLGRCVVNKWSPWLPKKKSIAACPALSP